jgi:hypothetical protein
MPTVSLGAPYAMTLCSPAQICQRPAMALAASDTVWRVDRRLVGQEASSARPPLPPLALLPVPLLLPLELPLLLVPPLPLALLLAAPLLPVSAPVPPEPLSPFPPS